MQKDRDNTIDQAFKNNKVSGLLEIGHQPEHIESLISHLYLYPQTVYKIYKRNNQDFNQKFVNLADDKLRKKFIRQDFFWNNYFNKEVYQRLFGFNVTDGTVEIVTDPELAEDLVIQMSRINAQHNLTSVLKQGQLKKDDLRTIGYKMTKQIAEFPQQPDQNFDYFVNFMQRLHDLREWGYLAAPHIYKENIDQSINSLIAFTEKRKQKFIPITNQAPVISIDSHSDNVVYKNNQLQFIDVMLPKEAWQASEPIHNIARLSLDILIWLGQKEADTFIQGYKDYYKISKIEEDVLLFHQLYSALVKAPYIFMLPADKEDRTKEANQYKKFILENYQRL